MRLVFGVMLVLLLIVLIGFTIMNPQTVSITLWTTTYTDVALGMVVIVALLAGAVLTSIVAIFEGTAIRLANRRLRREIHRLETELHFVRTQPLERTDAPATSKLDEPGHAAATPAPPGPVYRPDVGPATTEDDDEDEPYAGGQAV